MKIKVYHPDYKNPGLKVHVATVDLEGSDFDMMEHEDALEYAFRWTQNLNGSWSIKEKTLDGFDNDDYNELVTVEEPLRDGLGHRSSMMGDIFVIHTGTNAYAYEVDFFGFKKAEI